MGAAEQKEARPRKNVADDFLLLSALNVSTVTVETTNDNSGIFEHIYEMRISNNNVNNNNQHHSTNSDSFPIVQLQPNSSSHDIV